ncbi:unnamed protein product [Amoebophrya sp. A25]|nr:unnamed protein product [Amoebophrya sp. A25]|eukprot:GSA25T00017781001.1
MMKVLMKASFPADSWEMLDTETCSNILHSRFISRLHVSSNQYRRPLEASHRLFPWDFYLLIIFISMAVMGDQVQQSPEPRDGEESPPPPPEAFPSGYHDGVHDFEKLNDDLLGTEITLHVIFRDGSQDDLFLNLHIGHDVARAKHMIVEKTQIAYGRIKLFTQDDGKLMMDPLSLSDIPVIDECAGGICKVEAEVAPEG